jgi:hypothetical protein
MEDGWEHLWDWRHQFLGTVTFGLWVRPWEDQKFTKWKSIGAFSAEWFDPEIWREAYPYWPFQEMDDVDAFWAAKIIMKFRNDHIEKIVEEGKLSEPGATKFLVDALVKRQEIIAKRYLTHISPFDEFKIKNNKLCFSDLSIKYGVADKAIINFHYYIEDKEKFEKDSTLFTYKQNSSDACIDVSGSNNYRVVRMYKNLTDKTLAPVDIHIHPGKEARIAGIKRHLPEIQEKR